MSSIHSSQNTGGPRKNIFYNKDGSTSVGRTSAAPSVSTYAAYTYV